MSLYRMYEPAQLAFLVALDEAGGRWNRRAAVASLAAAPEQTIAAPFVAAMAAKETSYVTFFDAFRSRSFLTSDEGQSLAAYMAV